MFHTLNKNEQEHETLKYTRETIKSLLFDDEFKVLTCHSQLGALSEYHSDSVCTHGRTKTSWLSLMRGVELKHPVETNFHCQHLVHVISLLIFPTTAGLEDWFSVCCCILIAFMVEMFRFDQWIQSDVNDEHFLLQKINIHTEQLILSECYWLQGRCESHFIVNLLKLKDVFKQSDWIKPTDLMLKT